MHKSNLYLIIVLTFNVDLTFIFQIICDFRNFWFQNTYFIYFIEINVRFSQRIRHIKHLSFGLFYVVKNVTLMHVLYVYNGCQGNYLDCIHIDLGYVNGFIIVQSTSRSPLVWSS